MVSHQIEESHACMANGRAKVQSRRDVYLSMWPHETGSDRLSREGTYTGEIVKDAGIREEVIWCRQSLRVGLWDLPFEKAPITPVLSE